MFTGLIQSVGIVEASKGHQLLIRSDFAGLKLGESICVNGVCLTLNAKKARKLSFDVGTETKRVTTLGKLQPGDPVNLERSLRVGDSLGGHWVTGHVADIGRVQKIWKESDTHWLRIQIPKTLMRFMILKGSVALDGISLTIAKRQASSLDVMIIPHTWTHTNLASKKVGSLINVEPDILAKYIQQR